MRELASLLVVVLLVYLFQCLCWAPTRAHVFSLEPGGESGKRKRGFLWSALKLTGYWANPLPPLQPLLVVDWPQLQQIHYLRLIFGGERLPIGGYRLVIKISEGPLSTPTQLATRTTFRAGASK